MAITNDQAMAILAGGAAVVVLYAAYSAVDRKRMPRQEIATVSFNAALDPCTEEEFFRPHHATENQQLQYTPHRYPNVTGGNISTVIHYGFSQLRRPAPQDAKWITRPPAEVQF